MKKISLKMVAMIAAMMMCLTAEAKTEDVGGRVIDAQGEPLPFVSVALLASDSTYIQGATSDVDGYFQIMTTDACCILRFSCGWLLPDYDYRRLLYSAILVHRISHQVC